MVKRTALYLIPVWFLSQGVSYSQSIADDYRRADSLAAITASKVYYSNIRPSWIGTTGYLFYENYTPEGTEYIIINAVNKSRRQAFDQKKFAASFESATGRKAEPGKLPIRNITFSERLGSFAFNYEDYNWICNLKDYRIVRRDRVTERGRTGIYHWSFRDELANPPVVSPDKKWTAFIRDFNVWIRSNDDRKEYQLSYDGGTGEYYSSYIRWSPDSKKLISCRVKPPEHHIVHYIESSPADQLQPKHYSFEYPKPGDAVPQLYPQLFDITAKKQIEVDKTQIQNQYSINNLIWTKNSRYFTFEFNKRGHQVYQVIRIEVETG